MRMTAENLDAEVSQVVKKHKEINNSAWKGKSKIAS
jgi:hypothetical protein